MRPVLFILSKTMRPPLALVFSLLLAPAALAATAGPADWRRVEGIDERVQAGLTTMGWRFEADGRALDPKSKLPADKAALEKAARDLRQDARRAALERANLLISKPKADWTFADFSALQTLESELPAGFYAALKDPNSDPNKLRAMANAELSTIAAYFDGGRTLADRQAAAQPVSAGTPGARVDLPYFSVKEKSVGDKLRAAASTHIAKDPFGRTVLARINGPDGKPDLPPIVIEDKPGDVIATYDYRRGAVVLDRELTISAMMDDIPPSRRAAVRDALKTREDLLNYLEAHPEAITSITRNSDVVLVHELTHAWQDRRDPVLREMARGNIPDTQLLEYEHEGYVTKNLYIHSKLKNDPASVKRDDEFQDYVFMMHGPDSWKQALSDRLGGASPARALTIANVEKVSAARLSMVQGRTPKTIDEIQARSLDLAAITRGKDALAAVGREHKARYGKIEKEIETKLAPERFKLLAIYYLGLADHAESFADRITLLESAERYARVAGDAKLIEAVRKAKEITP